MGLVRIITVLLSALILLSCAKGLTPISNLDESNLVKKDFKNYDFFVFQMHKSPFINSNQPEFPYFKEDAFGKSIVAEEVYLLVDKAKSHCYYLTTFSHKYMFDGGVFNNRNYNTKIYINDLDYVLYGNIMDDSLVFKNKAVLGANTKDDIYIDIKFQDDSIQFVSITDDSPNSKSGKKVIISKIMNMNMIFEKTNRKLIWRNRHNVEAKINSFSTNCNDIYFKSDLKDMYVALKGRFRD